MELFSMEKAHGSFFINAYKHLMGLNEEEARQFSLLPSAGERKKKKVIGTK